MVLGLTLNGCNSGPGSIRIGEQTCDHCIMTISDERFAAQIVTEQGRQYAFDAIECMVAFVDHGDGSELDVAGRWVPDFERPGEWVDAGEAVYLQSDALRSPMALNFSSYKSTTQALGRQQEFGGDVFRWNELRSRVTTGWYEVPEEEGGMADAGMADAGDGVADVEDTDAGGGVADSGAVSKEALAEDEAAASKLQNNQRTRALHAGQGQAHQTIAAALEHAQDGDTVFVHPGVYREHALRITRQIALIGIERPVIDVNYEGEGLRILADGVLVQGFEIRGVPTSHSRDHAAIRLDRVKGGTLADNVLDDTFFGIYLARSDSVIIRENVLRAYHTRESSSANGIHLWDSNHAVIEHNTIIGHRDGIYLEYVSESSITENHVQDNLRYGLHFMFSDDCVYAHNHFESNGAGAAVMYSRRVLMHDNLFVRNWGAASYGLLLKDITDSEIRNNRFVGNSTGLRAEGSDRIHVHNNAFTRNGWAIRIMANSLNNHITQNNFIDNAFDVSTNSRRSNSTFEANYWDKYSGYDLVGDGYGDVPYRPVRLFSLIVERNPMALILLRSMFVQVLDLTERIMPTVTPETLVDEKPLMRQIPL